MTESFVPTPHTPAENRLSLLAAIFLGLAATLTAFSAYQAALEDGDSLTAFTESNHLYGVANQVQVGDRQLFVEFATTAQDPDAPPRAAAYIRTLMRPEMVAALDWWLDNDESLTPFDDLPGNPYEVAELDQADVKAAAAKAAYDRAIENDEVGDRFDLATVLFALTLFFGGIATLFRRYAVSVGLLVVAALSLAAGSVQLTMALAA